MKIRYLTPFDYDFDIEEEQLIEINGAGKTLTKAEQLGQEDIAFYLTQEYDLTQEFTNTGTFSITQQYKVTDRIYLDATSWTSSNTYNLNDMVTYTDNSVYIYASASIGPTTSFPIDNTDWVLLGDQYDLFYINYPAPLFDSLYYYKQGDVVYWNGFTYSCQSPTQDLSLTARSQFLYQNYVPDLNVFPDDTNANSNSQFWLAGSTQSYVVPIGTLPTDSTYWTNGDNRCQIVLNALLDIVIFYLHRTISPKNIPELRKIAYKRACDMLEAIAEGKGTITALARQNGQGTFFSWGGNTPDGNNW